MMRNLKIILIGTCLLLSACSLPPKYTGDKFSPTHTVDIYYSEGNIKKPYKIIGYLESHKYIKTAIENNMRYSAKQVGGDAVVILPEENNRIKAEVLKYQ